MALPGKFRVIWRPPAYRRDREAWVGDRLVVALRSQIPSAVVEGPLLLSLVGRGIMAGALGTIANDLIVRGKLLRLWVDQRVGRAAGDRTDGRGRPGAGHWR